MLHRMSRLNECERGRGLGLALSASALFLSRFGCYSLSCIHDKHQVIIVREVVEVRQDGGAAENARDELLGALVREELGVHIPCTAALFFIFHGQSFFASPSLLSCSSTDTERDLTNAWGT